MFIRAEKSVLLNAIAPCLCAVATRSASDSLSCLQFKTNKEKGLVTITTFDNTKGVRKSFEALILEEGTLLLDAVKTHSMIRALPDGEISLSSDVNFNTTLSAGSAKFEISGLSGDLFPAMPLLAGEKKFDFSQGVLKKMIQQVIFSAAVDNKMPILTGVLFETFGERLRLCACDGYRIALREEAGVSGLKLDVRFVVPAKSLLELVKLLSDSDEEMVRIELGSRHMIVIFETFTFFSRYVDGDYIDYRKSMPKEFKTLVRVNLHDIISSFERCSLLIDERAQSPIKLEIGTDRIQVMCKTVNGRIDEEVISDVNGEGMLVGFNNRFLLEAARACKNAGAEEVEFQLNSPLSSMAISLPDRSDFYYLVVPTRLNG